LSNITCKLSNTSVVLKKVHPRTYKLSCSQITFRTPENLDSDPLGVREPPVGNRCTKHSCNVFHRLWQFIQKLFRSQ